MKYSLILLLSFCANAIFPQSQKNWTFMYYAVGSNSSETDLLNDVAEMKRGKTSEAYHFIMLIDRVEGYSEDAITLDGNFTDTRLYQIEHQSFHRLDGKEFLPQIGMNQSYDANMADALTLKRFIQYCKQYYPAKHYMLILRSHGDGIAMCPDSEGGTRDRLYPAELTQVLRQEESVDILGLDVCSMAGLENLYQWRPGNKAFSAGYVLASAPLSGAWAYDRILERLVMNPNDGLEPEASFVHGGTERTLNPNDMTPKALATLIFKEIYDSQRWSSWGLFDNSHISELKSAIDKASRLLVHEKKALILDIIANTLGYHHNISDNMEIALLTVPYIDAYHFWNQIATNEPFGISTRNKAKEVCQLIDELVMHSYYGQGYFPETNHFTNGSSGVYQIVPQGNKIYSQTRNSFWSHCNWYHPDATASPEDSYGQYDWCRDGATRANGQVDNFFELLDFLFDETNDQTGGVNQYQW